MAEAVAEYNWESILTAESSDYLWTQSGVNRCMGVYEELEKPKEGRAVSASQRKILGDPITRQTFLKDVKHPQTGEEYSSKVSAWTAFLEKGYITLGKEDVWVKKGQGN